MRVLSVGRDNRQVFVEFIYEEEYFMMQCW